MRFVYERWGESTHCTTHSVRHTNTLSVSLLEAYCCWCRKFIRLVQLRSRRVIVVTSSGRRVISVRVADNARVYRRTDRSIWIWCGMLKDDMFCSGRREVDCLLSLTSHNCHNTVEQDFRAVHRVCVSLFLTYLALALYAHPKRACSKTCILYVCVCGVFVQSETLWVRCGAVFGWTIIRAVFLVLYCRLSPHSQLFRYSKEKHYIRLCGCGKLRVYICMLFNKYVCVWCCTAHSLRYGKNQYLMEIAWGKFDSLFSGPPLTLSRCTNTEIAYSVVNRTNRSYVLITNGENNSNTIHTGLQIH